MLGRVRLEIVSVISSGTQRRLWVLPATFVVAFVMFALPVGEEWKSYMPAWVTLVLIYWCLAAPKKITLGTGWLIGLALDILAFGLLGRYALTKTLITYLTRRVALRVRVYPVWQQSVFEKYRADTYVQAGFKPFIIAAMILANRFENPQATLEHLMRLGAERVHS